MKNRGKISTTKTGSSILISSGVFTGIIGLIMLFNGKVDAFFGALIISLGFFGLGWAGRRLTLPGSNSNPRQGISLVIGVVFGGTGGLMLLGSLWLFVEEEFGGGIGLGIFGIIFCMVAYFGSRLFSVPAGKKEILVNRITQDIGGALGQSGSISSDRYVYIDQQTPDTEIKSMQQKWSEQPWTQRDDWAEGKVIQQGPGSMRLLIGFTILWNIIGWSISIFGIWSEWGTPNVPWFLLVFPGFGIVLSLVTLCTWIRHRKFGISILHLKTIPAYAGEWLRGTVQTGFPVQNHTAQEFCVRLICVQRTSRLDSEGERRASETNLWSAEQTVFGSVAATSSTFDVPVNFTIPDQLPPTAMHPEDDRILWRLEISSSTSGVDYTAQFEVPVFRKD